ncbi:IS110 family transposase [Ruegeria atlantica]|uniref:IS110 family transposase n=1 Tax=Ruegeria atlantica TaxID=81569 RepID=UPI002495816C|nr:IS110 family transposase [Ruegeria atlantica]
MEQCFVGLDVSKAETSICVCDENGATVSAVKKVTDPDVICQALRNHGGSLRCAMLETSRMANWLYTELSDRGLPMVCIDTRQAHAVLSQMHNKTDANDAAILAELARTGFYRKVEVRSRVAQELPALLKAREVALKSRVNVENTIRGLLVSFGLRLPRHLHTYEERIRAILKDRPVLSKVILPLLELRTTALRQAAALSKEMMHHAKDDEACQRLMTIPGVGPVSALTFVATIDNPSRFPKSRSVGAYLGLAFRRYQSGDIDYGGRISRRGDPILRSRLYEAASRLLNRVKPGKGLELQRWARALKARASHKKAVVALARKLAVLMHAIWANGSTFQTKEP